MMAAGKIGNEDDHSWLRAYIVQEDIDLRILAGEHRPLCLNLNTWILHQFVLANLC